MEALYIEHLLQYGLQHGLLESLDMPLARNEMMDLLGIKEPYEGDVDYTPEDMPVEILAYLTDYAVGQGFIEDSGSARDVLEGKLMAVMMPRPSELKRTFDGIKEEEGVEAATDYYYSLSKHSHYIRMDRIALNRYWTVPTKVGELEITINLSKPEKDPKDIERAKLMPQSNYPKCLLCLENVGYPGHANHPARSHHRVLPLELYGEDWYLQYSPYVYYNEHAIIFKGKHEPMKVCKESFIRLTDFVKAMPHYFIGSNADLPIVGGSILSHDHFQGGHHRFAMVDAPVIRSYRWEAYPEVNVDLIKWPLSVIRLASANQAMIIEAADEILAKWREYSDESATIFAYTKKDEEVIAHNTITPIVRMNDQGLYEIDLTLRNNLRTEEHPDGLYHPHAHLHHIKKENIGLIEVMGLAVLPARLQKDMEDITPILMGLKTVEELEVSQEHHIPWIGDMLDQYGDKSSYEEAVAILQKEIGLKFEEVLACAGVYKLTEEGLEGFHRFMSYMGCIQA